MADEEDGRPRIVTGEIEGWKKCLLIFLGVGMLLLVIILPISFVGVEYYEVRLFCIASTLHLNIETAVKMLFQW